MCIGFESPKTLSVIVGVLSCVFIAPNASIRLTNNLGLKWTTTSGVSLVNNISYFGNSPSLPALGLGRIAPLAILQVSPSMLNSTAPLCKFSFLRAALKLSVVINLSSPLSPSFSTWIAARMRPSVAISLDSALLYLIKSVEYRRAFIDPFRAIAFSSLQFSMFSFLSLVFSYCQCKKRKDADH